MILLFYIHQLSLFSSQSILSVWAKSKNNSTNNHRVFHVEHGGVVWRDAHIENFLCVQSFS
jgi:hypothetical protein